MNKTYRTIWNKVREAFVVVSEIQVGKGGPAGATIAPAVIASVLLLTASSASALPAGGQVAAGQAVISTPSASQMNIKQGTNQAIINWNSFGIGKGEAVNISQPTSQSTLLNRVLGNNPSEIFGSLTANGKVFLVNPSGILFAPGASVNVGGMVASSLNIKDSDFLADKFSFYKDGTAGAVVNQGTISGGFVALLGNTVENTGTIVTTKGTTGLAAGDAITLGFDPMGLMAITVDKAAYAAQVRNSGVIEADGGTVVMTASAADALLATVVNNSGTIRANSMVERNGEIVIAGNSVANSGTIEAKGLATTGGKIELAGDQITLATGSTLDASGATGGGTVLVGGDWQGSGAMHQATTVTMEQGAKIDVSATYSGNGGKAVLWSDITQDGSVTRVDGEILAKGGSASGDGGKVETSGHTLTIGEHTRVSASATHGASGEWLLDPTNFTIAAGSAALTTSGIGASTIENTLSATGGNTNMSITTSATANGSDLGDIIIDTPLAWSANTLSLSAHRHVLVNSVVGVSGTGALTVTTNTSGATDELGTGTSTGTRQGYLKFKQNRNGLTGTDTFDGKLNWTSSGALTINSAAYTIVSAVSGTAGTDLVELANGSGNYALAGDLNLNSVAWTPMDFSGKLEGLGHTLSNLSVTGADGQNEQAGFIRYATTGTVLQNIGLVNAQIVGKGDAGTGAFISRNNLSGGTIILRNLFVDATSTVTNGSTTARNSFGGFVGEGMRSESGLGWGTFKVVDGYNAAKLYSATTSITNAGGIVGNINPSSTTGQPIYVTLMDVYNVGEIVGGTLASKTGGNNAGGLIGFLYMEGPGGSVRFENLRNYEAVFGGSYVGGVGGQISSRDGASGGTFDARLLTNHGAISGRGSNGGIFGLASVSAREGTPTRVITLSGVTNKGVVASTDAIQGGIIGLAYSGYGHELRLVNVVNEANISGSNRVGGLIGESGHSGNASTEDKFSTVKITDAVNSGTILSTATNYVGGIIGSFENNKLALTNVYNLGTVASATLGAGNRGALMGIMVNASTSSGLVLNDVYAFNGKVADDLLIGFHRTVFANQYTTIDVTSANIATRVGVVVTNTLASGNNVAVADADFKAATLAQLGFSVDSTNWTGGGGSYASLLGRTTPVTINITSGLSSIYGTAPSGTIGYTLEGSSNLTLSYGNFLTVDTLAGSYSYDSNPTLLSIGYSSGSASDYAISWGTNSSYIVTRKPLTITAPTVTKTYDGTTSATGTSTYNVALASNDSVFTAPTLTFNTKDYGLGSKIVTPTAVVIKDGNTDVTASYAITYTPNTASTINKLGLTVTAPTVTKTYDAGLTASGNATRSSLGRGDSITTAAALAYIDANAGTSKTVRPSALVVNDGNSGLNYNIIYIDNTASVINKKPVGLTVAAKTYDGSTSEAGKVTITTGVGSETLTYSGAVASSKDVSANTTNYLSGLTLLDGTGGLASNYTLPTLDRTNAAITINAKPVTLTGSMTYSAATSVVGSNLSATNLVGSDTLTIGGTGTASAADVGTRTLTLTGLTLSNSNYTITTGSGSVVINPYTLTFGSPTISAKTYDGGTTASVANTFAAWGSNVLSADTSLVTFSGTATFADKNVGSGKSVSIANIAKSGTKAGNYQFTGGAATVSLTSTGTITAKTLTLAGTSSLTKTYDGTVAMASGVTGYGTLGGVVSGDAVSLFGAPVWSAAGAGSGKTINQGTVALTGSDVGNYSLSWSNGSGTINKATLTMTANDAAKLIGQTDPTFTTSSGYRFSGFVNGEDATSASITGASVSRTGSQTAAATYTGVLAPTFSTNANYQLSAVNGNFTIVPADTLLVTVGNSTKTYGSAVPTLALATSAQYVTAGNVLRTVTLTNTSGSHYTYTDTLGTTGAFDVTSAATTGSYVGNYGITLSNFTKSGNNFTNQATQAGNLAITQLGATLGSGTVSRIYDGTTNASGTVTLANKVGSDDVGISGVGSYTSGGKNVGTGKNYTLSGLTLSGAASGNYYLSATSFSGSTGIITARPLTWSVDNASSTYGTTATVGTGRLANTIAGDAVTPTVTVYQSGTSTVVTPGTRTVVGSYDEKVSAITGADIGNYTLPASGTTGTLTIGAKSLVFAAPSISKTYDGLTSYTTVSNDLTAAATAAGVVSGDTLTGLSLVFDTKNAGSNKGVTASGATFSGSQASNYSISYAAANTGTIAQKSISVTAPTAANKVYDGLTSAALSGGALTGVIAADTDYVSLLKSGAFATATAGDGKTVNLSYGLSGTEAGNYSLSSSSGTTTANISKAALTMTANDAAKLLTENEPTFTARYSGFVHGEDESALTSHTVTRPNFATDVSAGTYANALLPAATSSNYTITLVNGSFTIAPAQTLLIQLGNGSKVYGNSLPDLNSGVVTSARYLDVDNSSIRNVTVTSTGSNGYSGDDGLGTTFTFVVGTTATAGSDVGNYALTTSSFSQSGANFTSQATQNGNLSITKRAATLAASGVSKTYDGTTAMSAATLAVDNRYSADANSSTGVTLTGTGSYADKNVGIGKSYTFTDLALSGSKSGNYYLTSGSQTNSDGQIAQRALAVTWSGIGKTYDGSTTATVATSDDRVNGDALTINRTAAFQTKTAGSGKLINVTGVALAGADWANYSISDPAAGITSATIAQRVLAVNYTGVAKTYDGTTAATVTTSDDRVSGDTLTINRTANFVDKMAGANKVINVTGVGLTDTDGANYTVASSGATAADINLKALTVTAPTLTKTYDGGLGRGDATSSTNAEVGSLGTNDSVNAAATLTYTDKNVGTASKTVQASALTIKDNNSADMTGNYAISYVDNTASSITAKALTVTAQQVIKVYDGTTDATGTGSVGTLAAGDSVGNAGLQTFLSKNVLGSGLSTVHASGVQLQDAFGADMSGNYTIAYTDNTASTITRLNSVTWIGGTTGNWFDPANWYGNAVPDLSNVAHVVIPNTAAVTFNNTSVVAPVVSGGTVNVDTISMSGTNGAALALSAGTLNIATSLNLAGLTLSGGTLGGAGSLTTSNNFSQTGGSITSTGALSFTQTSGTLTLGNISGFSSLGVSSAGDITQTSSTVIGGSGTLTKAGSGTLTLSGANTYTGLTTVTAGVLQLGAAGDGTYTPLGTTGSGTVISASGASLDLNGFVLSTAEALTLNGTGVASGGALTNSSATATYSGLITLGSASSIVASSGSIILSNTGTITGSGFGLTLGGTADSTLASIIGTQAGAVAKTGTGKWTLSGANTYTGATTVNQGSLKAGVVSVADTSGAFGNNSAVTLADTSGVVLDITSYNTQIGSLTGGGATGGNVTLGSATVTIGGDNTTPSAYAGVISGTDGAVTKIGTGTLTLSGANTYTGSTTISAGTLSVATAAGIGSGSISLGGGTLAATGDVDLGSRAVTLSAASTLSEASGKTLSGGIFSAASSILTLTGPGNFTLTAATNDFGTVNASGGNITLVDGTGGINLGNINATGTLHVTTGVGGGTGGVLQTGPIVVSGTSIFTASTVTNQDAVLTNVDNDFGGLVTFNTSNSGSWRNVSIKDANALQVVLASTGVSTLTAGGGLTVGGTTGNLTTSSAGLSFGSGTTTVSGNLAVTSTGAVNQTATTGDLTVTGTANINAGSHSVSLDNSGNDFIGALTVVGGTTAIQDKNDLTAHLTTTGDTALTAVNTLAVDGTVSGSGSDLTTHSAGLSFGTGPTTVSGDLAATSSGAVNQTATTGDLTVTGTANINAGSHSVSLDNSGNDFIGALTVVGGTTAIQDKNDLTAHLTTTGDTALTAVNTLAVDGTVSGSGSDLTTHSAGLSFGSGTTTVNGDLEATSSGPVTQSNVLTVNGTSNINAGSNSVTLNNSGNDFVDALTVTGGTTVIQDKNNLTAHLITTGDTALTAANALAVDGTVSGSGSDLTTHSAGLSFGTGPTTVSGDLAATSTGPVTQSNVLTVNGTSNINAGSNSVTLDNAGNDFVGDLTVVGGTTAIKDKNNLTAHLDTGDTVLTAVGILTVDGTADDLTTTSTGLSFGTGPTTVSGDLAATSAGPVTQTNALTVTGTANINAGSNSVTLDNAGNDFVGDLTVTGGTTVIKDKNNLTVHLNTGDTVLTAAGSLTVDGTADDLTTHSAGLSFGTGPTTVSGDLEVTSTGPVTQTNALHVGGETGLNAGGQDVTLTHPGNEFGGGVSAAANTLTIAASGGLTFAAVNVASNMDATSGNDMVFNNVTVGGNLIATSTGGNISKTGNVQIGGTKTLSAPMGRITGILTVVPTEMIPSSTLPPPPSVTPVVAPVQPPPLPTPGGVGTFVSGGFTEAKTLVVVQPVGAAFVYPIPENTFSHSNPTAVVTLEVRLADGSPLPAWMSFDSVRKVITGKPPQGVTGEFDISVIARDQFGGEAQTVLKMQVGQSI